MSRVYNGSPQYRPGSPRCRPRSSRSRHGYAPVFAGIENVSNRGEPGRHRKNRDAMGRHRGKPGLTVAKLLNPVCHGGVPIHPGGSGSSRRSPGSPRCSPGNPWFAPHCPGLSRSSPGAITVWHGVAPDYPSF